MRTVSALLLLAAPVYAGNCPQVFVRSYKAPVVLQQYAVAYPQIYAVGAGVQQEAIIEAAVSRALQRFQATVTRTETRTEINASASSQAGATVQAQSHGLAGKLTRCNSCHGANSANPKAVEHWQITEEMTCEERLLGIRAMQSGKMPPATAGAMTPQQAGDHIGALSGVEE